MKRKLIGLILSAVLVGTESARCDLKYRCQCKSLRDQHKEQRGEIAWISSGVRDCFTASI